MRRDDDYASPGKPPCDWDDPAAREALVDELVHDALAALAVLDGQRLAAAGDDAAELLALVAGQDVEEGDDGVFRIARGVARDRVISTVDTEARHGHKSRNRRFDGYKAHLSVDPDSELIDEVVATPANAPDRDAVDDLLGGPPTARTSPRSSATPPTRTRPPAPTWRRQGFERHRQVPAGAQHHRRGSPRTASPSTSTQAPSTCPAGQTAAIRPRRGGGGKAQLQARAPLPAAAGSAPRRAAGAPSPSTPKRRSCNGPRRQPTPPGKTATGPTGPPSNARSATSPAGPGAGARPAPAG